MTHEVKLKTPVIHVPFDTFHALAQELKPEQAELKRADHIREAFCRDVVVSDTD